MRRFIGLATIVLPARLLSTGGLNCPFGESMMLAQ